MVRKRSDKTAPREFEYKGQTKSLNEWAKEYNIHPGTIRSRYRAGWEIDRILTEPTIHETREDLQERTYKFIIKYKKQNNGNSPSMQDIAEACGTTTSNIHTVVIQLQNQKLLRLNDNKPRAIEVIGSKWIPPEKE